MRIKGSLLNLFLCFNFLSNFPKFAATPIKDELGNTISTEKQYNIVAANPNDEGHHRGLELFGIDPMYTRYVVQCGNENDKGIPVIFSNMDTTNNVIHPSTMINIRFSVEIGPSVWKLSHTHVTTGGVERHLDTDITADMFSIHEKIGPGDIEGYMIALHPIKLISNSTTSDFDPREIGVSTCSLNGHGYLTIDSPTPLLVKFIDAT